MQMQSGLGKCFRYILSHETGKIEILGVVDEQFMLFKYHQAKRTSDAGRIFTSRVKENQLLYYKHDSLLFGLRLPAPLHVTEKEQQEVDKHGKEKSKSQKRHRDFILTNFLEVGQIFGCFRHK